jgi:hypothetical protein
MKNKTLLLILFSFLFINTGFAQNTLPAGIWRGVLKTATGNNLPFNFMLADSAGAPLMTVMNGDERIKVTDIKLNGDSVFIRMPLFDSEFKLRYEAGFLVGKWIKHLGVKDVAMDFVAQPGANYRFFKSPMAPAANLTGRWSAIFGDADSRDTTVGEFTHHRHIPNYKRRLSLPRRFSSRR